MSNDDRSRRVWRLLERGWTSARALRDTIEQVRERVDEARVRLSDEVVSRIAGQPVRTQPDPNRSDRFVGDDGPATEPVPPAYTRPSAAVQEEVSAAASNVSDEAVAKEAEKVVSAPAAPPPAPIPEPVTDSRPPAPSLFDTPGATASHPEDPRAAAESPAAMSSWADMVDGDPGQPGETSPTMPGVPDLPQSRIGRAASPAPFAAPDEATEALLGGAGEIVVLARDAEWLFVYWDLDGDRLDQAVSVRGDLQFLLRIVQPSGTGLVHQSSAAVPSGRRYVRVPFADASYLAELWARGSQDEVLIVRSSPAATPPSTPRPAGFAMVSSRPHSGVLNAAWDLSRVPSLKPEDRPEIEMAEDLPAPEIPAPVQFGAGATFEVDANGSEVRLMPAAPVPGLDAPEIPGARSIGSEARLEGDLGSEARLGPSMGSEFRLAGPDADDGLAATDASDEPSPPKADK